jgi:oxygen-dependent protoporphyrinogen oxidase
MWSFWNCIGVLFKKKYPDILIEFFESSKNIGGRVGSKKVGDKYLDFGGKNIGYKYKLFREFVKDQGDFEYEYFGVNTSKVVDGKIVPINREKNFKSLIRLLKLANLFDLIKLFYLLKKVKNDEKNGFLNSTYFNRISNKLDKNNLSNFFSHKCCSNIIRALTVRMNGAEPEECYIGNFGTNLSSAFDRYGQIKNGIYSVIEKFLNSFSVFLESNVTDLIVDSNKKICAIKLIDHNGQIIEKNYDSVIIATDSIAASKIVSSISSELSKKLSLISYYPVLTLITEYEKDVFNKDVRAVLFDKNSPLSNAGSYGINSLNIVRYTFSGKASRDLIKSDNIDQNELFKIINFNMPKNLNIKNNKIISSSFEKWNIGLCAYSQYHHELLSKIKQELKAIKGLYITGDYISGASIEACFYSANNLVSNEFEF